ncbi:MAG: double-strand break repair protein AddB [Thalassobaculaceae bacterium]|nr:double-strand break repair protein AddB [Thalassobaculaceae bacterium]
MTDRIYTIPIGTPFLDRLAAGVWNRVDGDPIALTDVRLLLPTRRAVRSAADAFLRFGDGRPMLLPKLSTISDVDEDLLDVETGEEAGAAGALEIPPAIPDLQRHLELMRLVTAYLRADPDSATPDTPEHAYRLAAALARLIDEVQMHGLDFVALNSLAPDAYAAHWDKTIAFLKIVTEIWPGRLQELAAIDPMARRDALMRAEAAALAANPPTTPVIVAGSTGSIPATAELMRAVLALPAGAIVLPGLDMESDAASWAAIGDDPTHPQHGLHSLLRTLGLDRSDVREWSPSVTGGRDRLIREAMRPAATTEAWRGLSTAADAPTPAAFDGLTRIDAASPREEAGVIALLMREVLEVPGKTAALVTPDRRLARRVAVELRRWRVARSDGERLEVNDSGGAPLANSGVAVFLRLLARAMVDSAPVALLSLLKHPLTACGLAADRFDRLVERLDRDILRGARPAAGLAGLRKAITASMLEPEPMAALLGFCDRLADALAPLETALSRRSVAVPEILDAHLRAAEALATSDDTHGSLRLWVGEAGEALARLSNEFADGAAGMEPIAGGDWPGLFDALLEGRVVRPRYGSHPRLHILGVLEARLLAFDRVILGGLNEGTWPAEPRPDPWMSRPMRRDFGLPAIDLAIGKAAHDVAMALGGREVFLTRSQRVDGSPTIPSRWLLRLDTVARALHSEERLISWDAPARWHALLDTPATPDPGRPPEPRPRLDQRPRKLPVTRIDTWLRDPYSIYARYILNLRKLDPLDMEVGAIERGNAIHEALDAFVRDFPRDLPPTPADVLIDYGKKSFAAHMDRPGVWAFWWPRFERVARWFVEVERERRKSLDHSATEKEGALTLPGPAGPFVLFGKADRIDKRGDGTYAIIDYKTGSNPTLSDLKSGRAPQLPLEAMILMAGGFAEQGLAAGDVASLEYWRVGGGTPPGRIDGVDTSVPDLVESARAGLEALIAAFDDESTPYHAAPDPRRSLRFNDYDHLARTGDWAAGDEGEG